MDHGATASFSTFIDWFSQMTEEDFVLRFGATANEAQVLTRRASALVPSDSSLTRLLRAGDASYEAEVAGLAYNSRTALLPQVNVGDELVLNRDYQNPYDANGIEVRIRGLVLGYIPRGTARILAPQMDSGSRTTAVIVAVDRGVNASVRLRISVESLSTD